MKNAILFLLTLCVCCLFAQSAPADPSVILGGEDGFMPIMTLPAAINPEDVPSVTGEAESEAESASMAESTPAPVLTDSDILSTVNSAPSISSPESAESIPPSVSEENLAAGVRPKIAVYVTGGAGDAESRALSTFILDALVKSGRYTAIERTDAFLAEITNEQLSQRTGRVDDAQISRLGIQSGVQFVCVADIHKAMRTYQISARILNVETAEVTAVGVAQSPLKTMDEMRRAADEVVSAMFGIAVKKEKSVRFGVRAAYNNTSVSGSSTTAVWNAEQAQMTDEERKYKFGVGHGFQIGVSTIISVTRNLGVDVGVDFVVRQPVTVRARGALMGYEISEYAMAVPVLLRYDVVRDFPLYIQGGVQLDIPFNTDKKYDAGAKNVNEPQVPRKPVDFGLSAGMGYRIGRSITVDGRAAQAVTTFDGMDGHRMIQFSAGVSYLY